MDVIRQFKFDKETGTLTPAGMIKSRNPGLRQPWRAGDSPPDRILHWAWNQGLDQTVFALGGFPHCSPEHFRVVTDITAHPSMPFHSRCEVAWLWDRATSSSIPPPQFATS